MAAVDLTIVYDDSIQDTMDDASTAEGFASVQEWVAAIVQRRLEWYINQLASTAAATAAASARATMEAVCEAVAPDEETLTEQMS